MIASTAALLWLLAHADALPSACDPEQIHLAPGDSADSMTVSWVTYSKCLANVVTYQEFPSNTPSSLSGALVLRNDVDLRSRVSSENRTTGRYTQNAEANSTYFVYRKNRLYAHTAEMIGLRSRAFYIYKVGNAFGWSRPFTFRSLPPAGASDAKLRVCIFGDLSLRNGVSIPYLRRAAKAHEIDLIIHVGDIAYDLHYRSRGNNYMNALEEIFARVPYVIVPGNHEEDGRDFYNIRHRFRMPNSPDSSNQFHTFSIGPVRFVGLSTELYYKSSDPTRQRRAQRQLKWLRSTLMEAAADRRTPWLIAYQHRPFFCSSTNLKRCPAHGNSRLLNGIPGVVDGLYDVLDEFGVDLIFAGHEHFYERFRPIAPPGDRGDNRTPTLRRERRSSRLHNASAPINIVTGAAGCKEPLTRFRKLHPVQGSLIRQRRYGYTLLTVGDNGADALRLEQISVQDKGQVIDQLFLTKFVENV